jgi:malonate decarboxylase alpha subunit
MIETFHSGNTPAFVETLDAVAVGRKAGMPLAPIMIYGVDGPNALLSKLRVLMRC